MIGITIANNSKFFAMAQIAAKSVEKHANIPIFIYTHGKAKENMWWKHELFEMFPNRTIFYFDADTIMLQTVNLRQFEDREEFIAVRDKYIANHEDLDRFSLDANMYFNAGVMIFNQRHRGIASWIASRIGTLKTKLLDQTYWNLAVKELEIPIRFLTEEWNYLHYDVKTPNVIIGHYTFNNNRSGLKRRDAIYSNLSRKSQW